MADEQINEARKNLPAEQRGLIAHARNDITIPFFSDILQPQDETLIQRGGAQGLKIYEEIERDPHAYAVLQKRRNGLVARDWHIEPASEDARDQDAAAFIADVLNQISFDQVCLHLLDATSKGYSVAEIVWTRRGAQIVPERIVGHNQRRFVFDLDWRPRLLTQQHAFNGLVVPDRKIITHRFGVLGNNPYGLGLGTRLFWCVLFKREGVAFWLTALEKFASPTPVGKYPQGTLPADQQKLLQSLLAIKQAGALVMPLGSEAEFLEATKAGNASYEEWCRYWDTQMSLAVFGSTLATYVEGQGSRAASETHKEAEEQIIDSDGDLLADTLKSTLLQWLVDYNFPGAGVPSLTRPRPKNEGAHEDLRKKKAENAKLELDLLFDIGGRVGPEKFAEVAAALAGIDLLPAIPIEVLRKLAPHIARARENLSAAAANGQLDPGNPQRTRALAMAGPGEGAHDHGMGELASQLGAVAEPQIERWLDAVKSDMDRAIARGDGLTEFAERLLAIDRELSIDPLGLTMAGALSVAELSGLDEVKSEINAKDRLRRRRAR